MSDTGIVCIEYVVYSNIKKNLGSAFYPKWTSTVDILFDFYLFCPFYIKVCLDPLKMGDGV